MWLHTSVYPTTQMSRSPEKQHVEPSVWRLLIDGSLYVPQKQSGFKAMGCTSGWVARVGHQAKGVPRTVFKQTLSEEWSQPIHTHKYLLQINSSFYPLETR